MEDPDEDVAVADVPAIRPSDASWPVVAAVAASVQQPIVTVAVEHFEPGNPTEDGEDGWNRQREVAGGYCPAK